MSHLHSSMKSLDSLDLATRNEHLKIAKRLNIEKYSRDEQVSLLIDEVDRIGNLLQLERIESAGTDKHHKTLVKMQIEIDNKNKSFDKLEAEYSKVKKERNALRSILARMISEKDGSTPADIEVLS